MTDAAGGPTSELRFWERLAPLALLGLAQAVLSCHGRATSERQGTGSAMPAPAPSDTGAPTTAAAPSISSAEADVPGPVAGGEAARDGGRRRRGNTSNDSFSRAKKLLKGVYADHRVTLYCGCTFGVDGELDFSACGYHPLGNNGRAWRIEWEHVVPAEAFGRSFPEWRDGHPACVTSEGNAFKGRDCARMASAEFRHMEADMFNLYPEIGELNGLRSNFSMAAITGEERRFGTCDVEIADHKFEPRPEVYGDVARTYQYMDTAYPGHGVISGKNRKLFEAWSAQDPIDAWECERARAISTIQGNEMGVVAAACREAKL